MVQPRMQGMMQERQMDEISGTVVFGAHTRGVDV